MPGPSLALLGVVRFRQPGGGLVIGTYAFVVAVWAIVALRPGVDPPPWERVDHFEVRGTRPTLGAVSVDGRWVRLMTFGNHHRQAAERLGELETYRRKRLQAVGSG